MSVSVSARDCEFQHAVSQEPVSRSPVAGAAANSVPRVRSGTPKPTLGFASRTEAIAHMRSEGATTSQIAQTIGIARKTVWELEAKARRKAGVTRICVASDVIERLGHFAADRGVTPAVLAARILETVADEGLIDAVLDDGDPADSNGEDA